MTKRDEETTKTVAKTLWSETVLEILYESLRRNKGDAEIRKLLKEVKQKGFDLEYVEGKVTKLIDDRAADRVRVLYPK